MSKREGELKSLFGAELKRQLPGFRMLQYSTNGAPDREVIGWSISTRWEFKHATPDFKSPADQELVCAQIAAAAHCRYVIWLEHRGIQKTMIVHPVNVLRVTLGPITQSALKLTPEAWCTGFDMHWLVDQVRKAHGV